MSKTKKYIDEQMDKGNDVLHPDNQFPYDDRAADREFKQWQKEQLQLDYERAIHEQELKKELGQEEQENCAWCGTPFAEVENEPLTVKGRKVCCNGCRTLFLEEEKAQWQMMETHEDY